MSFDAFQIYGAGALGGAWPVVWNVLKIVALVLPLLGAVAYLTLWERKAIGWSQIRPGPNRVGPFGLLQPIADAVKLIFKEIIVPTAANPGLFFLGPVMTIMPALAAWAVIPFGPETALANINAGLLFLMAITSMEVYGVIIAGWASNSKYAFLGAMRAAAQMVSAETNRAPFDVVEGESEIVAGHMVEYSGMAFAMFFLAEYANIILVSALASVMFLGGWYAPVSFSLVGLQTPEWIVSTSWFWNWFWLFAKTFVIATLFLWARATFPRYRYDQIMRLGWKIFIPVTLVWLVVVGLVIQSPWNLWK